LNPQTALIFCNQKLTVTELQQQLAESVALQGDLLQEERNAALARFQGGNVRFLVATDVAARGLDLDSMELVVHYDLPNTPENWVHRSGRTGRAGASGLAVALLRPGQGDRLLRLAGELPMELEPDFPAFHTGNFQQWSCFCLQAGRRSKLRAGDVLGALTQSGGLPGAAVGRIDVQEKYSFVSVHQELADQAEPALRQIKGRRVLVQRIG